MQFLALLAMSLRWSSQLASKVSEGNCTKGIKRRTALPFLMLERPGRFDSVVTKYTTGRGGFINVFFLNLIRRRFFSCIFLHIISFESERGARLRYVQILLLDKYSQIFCLTILKAHSASLALLVNVDISGRLR
jgi:hypothetical protein